MQRAYQPTVLTLMEAAELLRLGRASAYALAREGKFPVPVYKVGGRYLVPYLPLASFLGFPSEEALKHVTRVA
jgi:excisionase family DNA binding protein